MPAPTINIKMSVSFIKVLQWFSINLDFLKITFLNVTIAFYLYILNAIEKHLMKVNKLMISLCYVSIQLCKSSYLV